MQSNKMGVLYIGTGTIDGTSTIGMGTTNVGALGAMGGLKGAMDGAIDGTFG